jgi:hypothetical protein
LLSPREGKGNQRNSIITFLAGKKKYTKEDRWQLWLRTIIITAISLTVFILV